MDLTKRLAAWFVAATSLLSTMSTTTVPTRLVGGVSGEFDVDNTGAATYTIPIEVPPGRNGMQPQLALGYNSHQGNGFLGPGWDLSGFPVIERCAATPYQDGRAGVVSFTDQDRFCLSGQRMIAVRGTDGGNLTEYRLEIDNQMKIVSYGDCTSIEAPCHFKAWTRSGESLQFGVNADARLYPGQDRLNPQLPVAPKAWALDKVTGRDGNTMTYHYAADNGSHYPLEIRYGGHAEEAGGVQRTVRFETEVRDDHEFSYAAGAYASKYRLKTITTRVGDRVIKQYRLTYGKAPFTGRSMLSSIADCHSLEADTCLPPTRLTYSTEDGAVSEDIGNYGKQTAKILYSGRNTWMVDLNKDGLPENVVLGDDKRFYVLVNASGRYCANCDQAGTYWGQIARGTIADSGRSTWFTDIDGDGYQDFVYRDDARQLRLVPNHAGTRFGTDVPLFTLPTAPANARHEWWTDIDLDGHQDYLWLVENRNLRRYDVHVAVWSASGYAIRSYGAVPTLLFERIWLVDMNADGLQDIVYRNDDHLQIAIHEERRGFLFDLLPYEWNSSFDLGEPVRPYASEWLMDINGDGAIDYVYKDAAKVEDRTYALRVAYGGTTGNLFHPQPNLFPLSIPYAVRLETLALIRGFTPGDLSEKSQWWGNLNGDNLLDYAYLDADKRYHIGHNNSGRSLTLQDTGRRVNGNRAWNGDVQWLVDIDGDAIADHLYLEDNSRYLRGLKSTGVQSDLLASIADGLGGVRDISYRSLSQGAGGFYSVGVNKYPYADAAPAFHVVSAYRDTDPASGVQDQREYWYAEGLSDLRGRGWLGFRYAMSRDRASGIRSIKTLNTAFPLTGTVASEILLRESDGAVLGETTHRYEAVPVVAGRNIQRVLKRSTEMAHYNPGTATPHHRSGHSYDYDGEGNLIRTTDLGDLSLAGDEISVCQNVVNDTSTWVIGRVVDIKTVRGTTCGGFGAWNAAVDLSWLHNVHDARENVAVECEWLAGGSGPAGSTPGCPAASGGQWRQVTHRYDRYGNLVASTDPLERVTSLEYDRESNTFVVRNILPDGTSQSYVNDPGFGKVVSQTDYNGVVSSTTYDLFGRPVATWGRNPTGQQVMLSTRDYLPGNGGMGMITVSRSRTDWDEDDTALWFWSRSITDTHGRTLREESRAAAGKVLAKDLVYDRQGRIARSSQPYFLGQATPVWTTYEYDWAGNQTRVVSPLGAVTSASYRRTRWNGIAVVEKTESAPSPIGVGTQTVVSRKDLRGNLVSTDFPGGGSSTASYDAFGRVLVSRDPRGLESRSEYDTLGRMTMRQDADTGITHYTYDINGHLLTKTDANGTVQRYGYDTLGRLASRSDTPASAQVHKAPDVFYHYDAADAGFGKGRLTSIRMPDIGLEARYVYDAQGNTAGQQTTFGGISYVSTSVHDPLGRAIETRLPDGSRTTTTYNAGQQLERRALLSANPAESETFVAYGEYDALGLPGRVDYSNGLVVTRRHDAIGRPSSTIAAGAGVRLADLQYGWSRANKLMLIVDNLDASRTQRFAFDARGQLVAARGTYGSQVYQYDANGNLTYKDGQYALVDGDSNRLLASHNGQRLYQYDANGNRTARAALTGAIDEYRYDSRDRLVEVRRQTLADPTPGVVAQYVYDDAGERLYKKEADGTEVLYLGPAYEITRVGGKDLHTRILNGIDGPVATITRPVGAMRLTTSLQDALPMQGLAGAFAHRAMTSMAALSAFVAHQDRHWPPLPHLLAIVVGMLLLSHPFLASGVALLRGGARGGLSGSLFRDLSVTAVARNLLVRITLFAFLVVSASPASAVLQPGANGVGVPEPGRRFFFQDHRDSSALVMGDDPAAYTRIEYGPHGEILRDKSEGVDNFRQKFTGKEFERDTGLYYYGSRYMDPATGGFVSADPAREFSSAYIYAANDPYFYTDPTGNWVAAVVITSVGLTYGYFSAAKSNGTFKVNHWDWTNASTYSKLLLGFAKGAITAFGVTSTGISFATFKQLGSKVTRKAAITTLAIASAEIAIELTNLLSLKFDIEWLHLFSLGLQIGLFAFDLGSLAIELQLHLAWRMPHIGFRLPEFSNPFDFNWLGRIDFNFGIDFSGRLPSLDLEIPRFDVDLGNRSFPEVSMPDLPGHTPDALDVLPAMPNMPSIPLPSRREAMVSFAFGAVATLLGMRIGGLKGMMFASVFGSMLGAAPYLARLAVFVKRYGWLLWAIYVRKRR